MCLTLISSLFRYWYTPKLENLATQHLIHSIESNLWRIIQLSKTEKQSRSLKGHQFHCSARYGKQHPFMIHHKMLIASIGLKNKNRPQEKNELPLFPRWPTLILISRMACLHLHQCQWQTKHSTPSSCISHPTQKRCHLIVSPSIATDKTLNA